MVCFADELFTCKPAVIRPTRRDHGPFFQADRNHAGALRRLWPHFNGEGIPAVASARAEAILLREVDHRDLRGSHIPDGISHQLLRLEVIAMYSETAREGSPKLAPTAL